MVEAVFPPGPLSKSKAKGKKRLIDWDKSNA